MSDALGKAATKRAGETTNPVKKVQALKQAQLAYAREASHTGSDAAVRKSIGAAKAAAAVQSSQPRAEATSKTPSLVEDHGLRHGRPVHHSPHR